jgi:hypothetical protein
VTGVIVLRLTPFSRGRRQGQRVMMDGVSARPLDPALDEACLRPPEGDQEMRAGEVQ